jgi:hypothetical protein
MQSDYGESYSEHLNYSFLTFFNGLLRGEIIFIFILSLTWAVMIHRSFLKALAVFCGLFLFFFMSVPFFLGSSDGGLMLLAILFSVPFIFILSLIGFLMRAYYALSSSATRLLLLITPLILLLFTIFISLR